MPADFGSSDNHENSLVISASGTLDNPAALTLAFWIVVNAMPTANTSYVVSKWDVTGGANGWRVRLNTNGTLDFLTATTGTIEADVSQSGLTVDTWAHVVVTWDGSNSIFYFDAGAGESTGHTQAAAASIPGVELGRAAAVATRGAGVQLAHVLGWEVTLTADEAQDVMNGMIPQMANLDLWYSGDGDPGQNQIDGTAATKSNTVAFGSSLGSNSGRPRQGDPGSQVLLDYSPRINRQDLIFDVGPRINRQDLLLEPGPQVKPLGINFTLLEPGPFLNPLKHVLDSFGTEGLDAGVPGRGNTPSGLLGFRNEETVTTPGTSSETVTKLAPSTISTAWTKGYSAITTLWKKGRHSYE